MDIGNCRKPGLEAPCMEKIDPVDVGTYLVDFIFDSWLFIVCSDLFTLNYILNWLYAMKDLRFG